MAASRCLLCDGPSCEMRSVFFFNDTATTEIYTLSLHDALPISIKVIRRVDLEDKIVNGVVLERRRLDPELPYMVDNAKILILKLYLKPVKESWIKENSKYQDILAMETDRLEKSKKDRKSTRLNSSHANISYAVF